MPARNVIVRYATIPLSGTVAEPYIDLSGARTAALWIPTITSAQVLLRASFDTTSANFVPVYNQNATPISSRWWVDAAVGSMTVAIDVEYGTPYSFLKLETSVAQAAVRSLAIITKL
jgi:hypothetical protein